MKHVHVLQRMEKTKRESAQPVKNGESTKHNKFSQGSSCLLAGHAHHQGAEYVGWYLRNEDAFVSRIKRISSMTFCSTPDADAQLFSWSLFNAYFLKIQKDLLVSGFRSDWNCIGKAFRGWVYSKNPDLDVSHIWQLILFFIWLCIFVYFLPLFMKHENNQF